jgi:hypothetical protein
MTESKPTFKTLIEKKYNELMKDISNVIELDDELFPKLDDKICWAELFKYIEFVFPDDNTGYNIEELFEFKGIEITPEQIEKLVPIVNKYLVFVNKIKVHILKKD